MNDELTQEERKEWARSLYMNGSNIKETAAMVKAAEGAVRQWIQEGSWDTVRRTLQLSKKAQLERLYGAVDALTERMATEEGVSPKDIDLMVKYTAAIKNLDTEYSTYTIIEVAEQFLLWMYKRDVALTQLFTRHFDAYIRERQAMQ